MKNICTRTNHWRWWTYIIHCLLNSPRCGFRLDKIIQTSNRNATVTVLVQVIGMWKRVILFRMYSLLLTTSPMKRKHFGVIIAVVVSFSPTHVPSFTCKQLNIEKLLVDLALSLHCVYLWQNRQNTLQCERRPGSPLLEAEP